jgi:hypothetical protein
MCLLLMSEETNVSMFIFDLSLFLCLMMSLYEFFFAFEMMERTRG